MSFDSQARALASAQDMQAALEADGEKLLALTGEDHGPFSDDDIDWGDWENGYDAGFFEGASYEREFLLNMVGDVTAFHKACGTEDPQEPQWPSEEKQRLRERLIKEEFMEVADEIFYYVADQTTDRYARLAGELVDLLYVTIGTMLSYGMPIKDVWDAKHKSNMAKVDPETGKVKRREDGKILKPDGWQPADVYGAIFD